MNTRFLLFFWILCVLSPVLSQELDCEGNIIDNSLSSLWLGDGNCDDGSWGIVFTCQEWNYDDGDCGHCVDSSALNYGQLASCEYINTPELITQCSDDELLIEIEILTDNYASETSWELINATSALPITTWSDYVDSYSNNTLYNHSFCIADNNCSMFVIYDSYGDGVCCGYGVGYATLSINEEIVFEATNFNSEAGHLFNCAAGSTCTDPLDLPSSLDSDFYSTDIENGEYWFSFNPSQNGNYNFSACSSFCETEILIYNYCPIDLNNGLDYTNLPEPTHGGTFNSCSLNTTFEGDQTYYIYVSLENCDNNKNTNFEISYLGPPQGCMDDEACNFIPFAEIDDGSCIYEGLGCSGPDLVVEISNFSIGEEYASLSDCRINEGCLLGYGDRTVLNFTTIIWNIGDMDYYIGPSPSYNGEQEGEGSDGDQFTWGECHGHWHHEGYANYQVYDLDGSPVESGNKNGFCVMDFGSCIAGSTQQYNCSNMGITAGCSDTYYSGLDCQFVDVTDLEPADYQLIVRVNWDETPTLDGVPETTYENNWASICFTLSDENSDGVVDDVTILNSDSCDPWYDCANTPFGNAEYDCNNICNGPSIIGDINLDTFLDEADINQYNLDILADDWYVTNCNDLDSDGELTVSEICLVSNCVLSNITRTDDLCSFNSEIINPNQEVEFSINNINIEEGYFDIAVLNDLTEIIGYQFIVEGVSISSVENLTDASITTNYSGNMVIGFSNELESFIDKTMGNPQSLCRLYFSNAPETICIESVIDVMNTDLENVLTEIDSSSCWDPITQEIPIPEGWHIISTYVNPIDKNMESVFNDIISSIQIVKNGAGSVYWPEYDLNSIGEISVKEGYQIKSFENTTLSIEGTLTPYDSTIDLPESWSLISYLHQEPANVEDLMMPLVNNLIIVKGPSGNVYWPEYNLNSLGNMNPGTGYKIKTITATSFSYPEIDDSRASPNTSSLHDNTPINTGNNMTIAFPPESWTRMPDVGDEIIIYDNNNLMVGKGFYNINGSILTAWGDDDLTHEKDGLYLGEELNFVLWRNKENLIENLVIHHWEEGRGNYSVDGISVAGVISSTLISERKIIKVSDLLGREICPNTKNVVLLHLYSDGSVERKYIIQ